MGCVITNDSQKYEINKSQDKYKFCCMKQKLSLAIRMDSFKKKHYWILCLKYDTTWSTHGPLDYRKVNYLEYFKLWNWRRMQNVDRHDMKLDSAGRRSTHKNYWNFWRKNQVVRTNIKTEFSYCEFTQTEIKGNRRNTIIDFIKERSLYKEWKKYTWNTVKWRTWCDYRSKDMFQEKDYKWSNDSINMINNKFTNFN